MWLSWCLDKYCTHFIHWPFHCRLHTSTHDWTLLFSFLFVAKMVGLRFLWREPEVFCRKLCVYVKCATGAKEMAGIMGFIYIHTHLHCAVSGTLTKGTRSCWETSLVLPHIETVFMSSGVTHRDYSGAMTRSCETAASQIWTLQHQHSHVPVIYPLLLARAGGRKHIKLVTPLLTSSISIIKLH